MILYARGDAASAADQFAESLACRREFGDIRGIASTVANLGDLALGAGDLGAAASYYQESLDLRRDLGDTRGVSMVLGLLGDVMYLQEQTSRAEALYREGLDLATRLGAGRQIAACRDGLTRVIKRQLGTSGPLGGSDVPNMQATTAACSGADDQPARWSYQGVGNGDRLPDGEASQGVVPGFGGDRRCSDPGLPNAPAPERLTRRERQVAVLVAQGLTNRQIAATLIVSERTVHSHVRTIMGKLAFTSRAQIAAWVARRAR